MRVLNTQQMRQADRATIDDVGTPSLVLMENAGRSVVEAMSSMFDELVSLRVSVLCGCGNNGGDGLVVARTLRERGNTVTVFLFGSAADVRGDVRENLERLEKAGLSAAEVTDAPSWAEGRQAALSGDVVVDALFGTGLSRPLTDWWAAVVEDLNGAKRPVVSVDLPSGLSADSHTPIGPTVEATATVTLAAPKVPLVLLPAAQYAGQLVVADIGIPDDVIAELDGPVLQVLTPEAIRQRIPERAEDTHKGDVGRILIVAGSVGKTGAACLAGRGALRSGAGLVTVATPRSCVPTVAAGAPEYMTLPLPERDGEVSADALERLLEMVADVVVLGPGLGTGEGAKAVVRGLLARTTGPLVLDADALNACVENIRDLKVRGGRALILTPHPGEMARLSGTTTAAVQADRIEVARRVATDLGAHIILKGARTLVATPDGHVAVNLTGNPGMATGGTGDVLAGAVGAWMGQLGDAAAASQVAVYLHGLAGDLAAEANTEVAMTATDLIDALGDAVKETIDSESERDGDDCDRP